VGALTITAYTGRLCPKEVTYYRLQVYKRVGISQVKVYENMGEICHLSPMST